MIPKAEFIVELQKAVDGSEKHWMWMAEHPKEESSSLQCDLCKFSRKMRELSKDKKLCSFCPGDSPTKSCFNDTWGIWDDHKTKATAQKALDRIIAIDVEAFADEIYKGLEEEK